MENLSNKEREILIDFMMQNDLSFSDVLYRYTSEEYLERDTDGNIYLKAKKEPIDMVIDKYHNQGHTIISSEFGQGLTFLKTRLVEYQSPNRVCVSVTLKEITDQSGLMYPVTSLPAFIEAFFFTIPDGKVRVKLLS